MNQVAKPNTKPTTLKSVLSDERVLEQIQRALPSHMDADRMARIAITAATRTPKLNECTIESLMQCLLDLSACGLEPDGRHAHLIPFRDNRSGKTTCTLIIDYKGLVAMAYRSGEVTSIHADVVYEGDVFQYSIGKVVRHEPWAFAFGPEKGEKQGEIIAAYAIVEMKNGAAKHEVMTKGEIDAIRKRSKSGSSGPWVTDYAEMAKKTVFRRASKWVPLSAEMRNHVEKDFDSLPPIRNSQARTSKLNNIVQQEPAAIEESPSETDTVTTDELPPEIIATEQAVNDIQAATDTDQISAAIGMAEQAFSELKLSKARTKPLTDEILDAAKAKTEELEG